MTYIGATKLLAFYDTVFFLGILCYFYMFLTKSLLLQSVSILLLLLLPSFYYSQKLGHVCSYMIWKPEAGSSATDWLVQQIKDLIRDSGTGTTHVSTLTCLGCQWSYPHGDMTAAALPSTTCTTCWLDLYVRRDFPIRYFIFLASNLFWEVSRKFTQCPLTRTRSHAHVSTT